jgi:hypothetical protein
MSIVRLQDFSRRRFLRTALQGIAVGIAGVHQSADAAYPLSSLANFRWVTQYLGQQSVDLVTHCCGPACAVMIKAFWNKVVPTSNDLWDALHWLDVAYGYHNPFYATQESQPTSIWALSVTDFAQKTNQIGQLLDHYGLHYVVYRGAMVPYTSNQSNLGNLLTLVNEGFPCMVGCSVSGGVLSTVGEKHFAVVTGFDGVNVILQNSGTIDGTNGGKGFNTKMSLKAFDDSWSTNSRVYIPVAPRWLF